MRPLLKKITYAQENSFSCALESPPEFETPWHCHPEYELILIQNSSGVRFMGDSIKEFKEIEAILVGPNLPHCWKCETPVKQLIEQNAHAVVIHFEEEFIHRFVDIPEGKAIRQLLKKSVKGLMFSTTVIEKVMNRFYTVLEDNNYRRVLSLIQILDYLSKVDPDTNHQLASEGFLQSYSAEKSERINTVMEYTLQNFKNGISLEDVAELTQMTRHSFCRFFKGRTGKSFFRFLHEIRIGYVCRQLQETNKNISQIAYESGFENTANFNRQFKKIMGMNPRAYKKTLKM